MIFNPLRVATHLIVESMHKIVPTQNPNEYMAIDAGNLTTRRQAAPNSL